MLMSKHQWFEELQAEITQGILKIDEPLSNYTMTKLGGSADLTSHSCNDEGDGVCGTICL